MKELQTSANENSKSSMGDKYETGRAMVHLEQENLRSRYLELEKQYKTLTTISPSATNKVQLGSLIHSNQGSFYISIGLGKIEVENEVIFTIAPTSPIGNLFMGLLENEQFEFNRRKYLIEKII